MVDNESSRRAFFLFNSVMVNAKMWVSKLGWVKQDNSCFYHTKFQEKSTKCKQPNSFRTPSPLVQGNSKADCHQMSCWSANTINSRRRFLIDTGIEVNAIPISTRDLRYGKRGPLSSSHNRGVRSSHAFSQHRPTKIHMGIHRRQCPSADSWSRLSLSTLATG